jgi:DNA-directed RNA polymerase subunit K/omega
LVLVASQRARKLYSGETPTVVTDNDKNTVIALREIADSTLTTDEMKENLIQEYQTVTLSDEEEEIFELESSKETINKNEESKSYVSDVEEEMKELVSSEDSEIEEQYEIRDDIEVNTVSDETEENTQSLE